MADPSTTVIVESDRVGTVVTASNTAKLFVVQTSEVSVPTTQTYTLVRNDDITSVVTSKETTSTVVVGGAPGPRGPAGASPEPSPQFSYTDNVLTRIDYPSGNYKVFNYISNILHTITYYSGTSVIVKVFYYNVDGSLQRIEETTL